MAKFKAFWNYQKKKTGEIVIAEEELQEMLDAAWGAGYNQGRAETASPRITPQNIPQNIPPVPNSTIISMCQAKTEVRRCQHPEGKPVYY